MPVAISIAKKGNKPSSFYLMPIAFASLFGGMTTLIGTPPNIIISMFRSDQYGEPFGMFSFAPVGIVLALAGVLFISLLGWRLLPKRLSHKSGTASFNINDYITELIVTVDSGINGVTIAELIALSNADIQILGLVREKKRIHAPEDDEVLTLNDIIIVEGDAESFKEFVRDTRLQLNSGRKFRKDAEGSERISFAEAVVMADSPLIGQTASGLNIRSRFGVNLVAVSRKEERIHRRLGKVIFRNGDVVMLQGREHMIFDAVNSMGCLPLARRDVKIGFKTKIPLSLAIFSASIIAIITGLVPIHIAFPLAAVCMVLSGILPIKDMYKSIDWPVIILLGAMLPVGAALETTGGAGLIAEKMLQFSKNFSPSATLTLLISATMLLSGIINNAATVVLMAPVAVGIANGMGYSSDPFLMTIAIGASSSFLTPIGHQSNTLVMGPGGYRFVDYIIMGLPVSVITILISVPLILYFWPV